MAVENGTVFCALLGCGEDSLKRKLLNLAVTMRDVEAALKTTGLGEVGGYGLPIKEMPQPKNGTSSTGSTEETVTETVEPTLDEIAPGGDLKTLNEKLAKETPEKIEAVINKTIRKDTKIIQALKQACEFRCQFPNCGIRIPKKDGGFYIEVAHIKPVRSGGPSVLGNLLVLCPNHHKEFDFGCVEVIEQTDELLHGKLNGKEFKIALTPYK